MPRTEDADQRPGEPPELPAKSRRGATAPEVPATTPQDETAPEPHGGGDPGEESGGPDPLIRYEPL